MRAGSRVTSTSVVNEGNSVIEYFSLLSRTARGSFTTIAPWRPACSSRKVE
jgi:hypothetical protein